jgi:hypothetical protein
MGSRLRLTLRGGLLRRRKSRRTESVQGVWHQKQRHTDAVVLKVGTEVGTAVEVLPTIAVMHGWAGAALASQLDDGWVTSTASGGASWEP